MKRYWNHRDAEMEMLLSAAYLQLQRPGYGQKFRDAVAEVTETLAKLKDVTKIVIAHRLSTVRTADRIYVLDAGRVAEEGTFDELMAKGGLFATLAKRQM